MSLLCSSLRRLSSSSSLTASSLFNRLHHHHAHQQYHRLLNKTFPHQQHYSSSIIAPPTSIAVSTRTFSCTTPLSTTAFTSASSSSFENKDNVVAAVSDDNGSDNNPSDDYVDTVFGVTLRKADYHPNLIRAISVNNGASCQKRRVQKQSIVREFRRSESDTGSPEVQIALMTHRINSLSKHMIVHKKDTAKKRDMDVALSQRRRMMKYLFRTSPGKFLFLILMCNKSVDDVLLSW